eukprot:GFUD01099150.1.p1 GENE.GFUD01099150.1~~GFUD01099150.1.p1  ORF type:complete len:100 (-),score=20.51 GFUD01099150.1:81-380(-)
MIDSSDENDKSAEFFDCELSEKGFVHEVNSDGFLIRDAYFEDRDMEHLEFVYDPSFMSSSNLSIDGISSFDSQCPSCTQFKLAQRSLSKRDIRYDPGML